MRKTYLVNLTLCALLNSAACLGIDIVKLPKMQSDLDVRVNYKVELLERALELTRAEYGDFDIQLTGSAMMRHRALLALRRGSLINVYFSPAGEILDDKAIAIKIPIRRGILSYRLLLIHKDDLPVFEKIKTLEDLKALKAGLQSEWITTRIMADAGFTMQRAQTYDGLFMMLESRRFHYIPRGIHEVYDELSARKTIAPNIVVAPNLALLLIMPTYTYVSASEPRLARRIESGLSQMVENGDLEALFIRHYADDIARAELHNRRIIEIDNPLFTDSALLTNKKLWFSPKQQ